MRAQRVDRVCTRLGRGIVAVVAVELVLWLVAPQALRPLLLNQDPTKPSTLVSFLLLGAVLGLRPPAVVRRVLLLVVFALALEGAVGGLLHRPLLSADVLYRDEWQAVEPTGQMPLASALVLASLALATLLSARRPGAATTFAGAAFGLAFVSLVGHVYGAASLTSLQTATAMTPPTVPVALAAALAVLLERPELPSARALRTPGTAGALIRQNVLWALAVPLLVGWLVVRGERAGWFDPAYGQALLVLVVTVGALGAVALGARTAARTEHAQAAVEDRERLQYLLDGTPVGIFETDAEGRRRYVNRRWRELAGAASGEDVEGGEWASVVHPEDRDRVAAEWAAAVAAGQEYVGHYRYLRADGTVSWVDAAATASRDEDGTVTRWLGSVSDVTDKVQARARLEESERRYRSVVATMAEGVVLQDSHGSILTANEAACRVLALDLDQLLGSRSIDPLWRAVREDGSEFPTSERPAVVALTTGTSVRDVTMGVYRSDGTLAWLEVAAEPLLETRPDGSQAIQGVVTTFSDVTAARAAARALARSEAQFRSAMAHAPVGMALVGLDGSFVEVNRALCRLVGYDEATLIGSTFQQVTHPDDLESDLENLSRLRAGDIDHYTMEKRYITREGEVVWVLLAVSLAHDDEDQPAHYVAQMQDITASRAAQDLLAHRALHDPLTGLANRDLLMDRLAHALSRSARSGRSTVVLFCDLDHFKDVNDGLGHEMGDLVLVTVAERLTRLVRPSDTVARLGGDEFVIVAEGLDTAAEQRALADRVRSALDEELRVAGTVVRTGASIGVAVSRPEDDARSLLREADATMYRAKARGRGRYEVSDAALGELGPIGS